MPKKKPCKVCQTEFKKVKPLQVVCSPYCAAIYVSQRNQKKADKAFNKETKRLKETLKTKGDYIKEARIPYNKWVKLRDYKDPCISCSRTEEEIRAETSVWQIWDCGHYLTVGGFPELRFEEDNTHKQCTKCNGGAGNFTRKNTTVTKEYRKNLIKKIGLERVEWLEGPHKPKKYTIEDLKGIKAKYMKKSKELLKQMEET